jgi:hypothetical protein
MSPLESERFVLVKETQDRFTIVHPQGSDPKCMGSSILLRIPTFGRLFFQIQFPGSKIFGPV